MVGCGGSAGSLGLGRAREAYPGRTRARGSREAREKGDMCVLTTLFALLSFRSKRRNRPRHQRSLSHTHNKGGVRGLVCRRERS